jgi:hypothetical protein
VSRVFERIGAGRWAKSTPTRLRSAASIATIVAATLLLTAPSVYAAPASTLIARAPYTFGVWKGVFSVNAPCGSARFAKAPVWNNSAGTYRSWEIAKVHACSRPTASNEAYAFGDYTLFDNLTFPSAGNHTLNVSWSAYGNYLTSIVPFSTCLLNYSAASSFCDVYSFVDIYVYVQVTDLTNTSWNGFYGTAWSQVGGVSTEVETRNFSTYTCHRTICTLRSGNVTTGSPVNFTGVIPIYTAVNLTGPAAIVKTDSYSIQIDVRSVIDVDAAVHHARGVGASSATAHIDVGSHRGVIRMLRIVLI